MTTTPTPRPVPTTDDRMRDARTDRTFATYLDRTERDQLDARAATAEQERNEALDDRDAYKEARDVAQQLATVRQGVIDRHRQELGAAGDVLAVVRDAVERIDRALAVYDIQPVATSVEPKTDLPHAWDTFDPDTYRRVGQWFAQAARTHDEDGDTATARHATWAAAVFGAYDEETPAAQPALGSLPPRAQDGIRPAAWEHHAIDAAHTALADAWTHLAEDDVYTEQVAITAVRAIIDAGLAGDGGRCRKCGSGFPRTLPAGQDPLCWTCSSEEQTGLDEYTPAPQLLPEYHWGRAWSPTSDEATCPCRKAPCGYVIRSAEARTCEVHGPTKTMRGGHPADRCPGAPS